ncbi:acyl-CoA dehydrogenase family protein [Nocardia stercoris]|uniref:Acyl-CoA dehydrogenase n=1 Tax=Nocardia stercoris TaxID=2483361 RepID=A0A3M2KT57_9NOCA|nr:acyl-CoA dehydrogenase family protein [Nocardia stercoris]RMI28281.1 acyl-CoA dehydrogenase [Nocardia stercoris]
MTAAAELTELTDTVRAVLTKHGGRDSLRGTLGTAPGFDEKLWRILCDQVGVAALAIPEEYGGIGAGLAPMFAVVEELGRTLHTPPLLGSALLATQALLWTGNTEACERLLPEVAEGSRVLALAWAGEQGWDTPGVVAADGVLNGTASYVLDGDVAGTLLVVTEDGLYEVDAAATGVTRRDRETMDPSRRLSEFTFDGVAATRLGDVPQQRLRELAWVALAFEQVGAADHCLWMTVEYTKTREQFGRPIGGFQALQHRMADMYVQVESARSMALAAAAALENGSPDTALEVASARRYCTQALQAVTAETVQMHGGIAITWEHDAHLYFKRAHGDAQLFGKPTSLPRPVASA